MKESSSIECVELNRSFNEGKKLRTISRINYKTQYQNRLNRWSSVPPLGLSTATAIWILPVEFPAKTPAQAASAFSMALHRG
jgi:hypothetical protein